MIHDDIGPWSEVKLAILRDYASAYSTIMVGHKKVRLHHAYIDAFAGSGQHFSRKTQEMVSGSPFNALLVKPEFEEYYFIELNPNKVESLQELAEGRTNVRIYHGDCNRVLLEQVFPRIRYDRFWRALCLLDPYGLQLDWEVICRAGQMQTIDMFLNFPIMHMNRDILLKNPEEADPGQVKLMNRFWGDDSWRKAAYEPFPTLFETVDKKVSDGNDRIAEAFRVRLKKAAGFGCVPKPLPMRNSKNAVVYYLFFASNKPVAIEIVEDIFNKYSASRR